MKICFLFLLLSSAALANDSLFDGTQPMTDQELEASETYLHGGMAQKIYQDQCVDAQGNIDRKCLDGESGFDHESTEKKIEELLPIVTPLYGQLVGMTPVRYTQRGPHGGPILTDGQNEFIQGKDGYYRDQSGNIIDANQQKEMGLEDKDKEGTDYCGMIPQYGATAVSFYESTMDQKTQENLDNAPPETMQAASFRALAKAQKDRATTSEIQFGLFASTAACYTALMATNVMTANLSALAKAGSSTLLAYFFQLKKKAHEERAAFLEKLASQYPGAGDCNPFTATTCFCNEESSPLSDPANYQAKCVPQGYKTGFNNDSFICVDAAGKADPACDCAKRGTCIESKFKTMGMQIGLNPSMMRDPLAGIGALSKGFGTSQMAPYAGRNLAYAKAGLKKLQLADLSNLALDNKKKNLAKEYAKFGLPKAIAASMASKASLGSHPPALATSGLGASTPGLKGQRLESAYKASDATKFKNAMKIASTKKGGSGFDSPFSRFGKKKAGSGVSGVQIMDFAEQAQREAEITKDTSRPIFDIITYRYKASAWREFRDQINQQIQAENEETQKK